MQEAVGVTNWWPEEVVTQGRGVALDWLWVVGIASVPLKHAVFMVVAVDVREHSDGQETKQRHKPGINRSYYRIFLIDLGWF